MSEKRSHGVDRRSFLKQSAGTVGVAGLASIAGCFGDTGTGSDGGDGGDGGGGGSGSVPGADGEMIMKTASETTAAYSMSQVIASAVSQNSEEVTVNARPSQGTNRNVAEVTQGKTEIAYVQNWTASKIREGKEPFGDLDYQPYQVFHLYDLAWFLASANDGWESVADIGSGDKISPTPRGSGTAEMLEYALGFAVDDYERISIGYSDQASAMSEGRLDAGAATYVNLSIEPGWLQQMKSTVDLRVLDWPDEIVSELEDDPSIVVSDIDMSGFEEYAYTPDTLSTPTLAYNFIVREDHDYDTLYNFLTTLWEQREGLQEETGLLAPMANGEAWTKNAYTDVPFHPAAADFYQEKGLWSDEFVRGAE